ncbi:MAG: replication restart helicase PriA [Planctomycetota bacterium]|jgi:primosomal protein N' (replication factor Y)
MVTMPHMAKLFADQPDTDASGGSSVKGPVVGVVVNANVWRAFDYIWPEGFGEPAVGRRVHVPFGRGGRKLLGVVVDCGRQPGKHTLKAIADVVDDEATLDGELMELGRWMNRYYLTPPGMTLAAMVPSAVGRHAAPTETVAYLVADRHDWPARLGGRQKRVLDELLAARRQGVEPLRLEELRHHSGASRETVKRLLSRELIRTEHCPVTLPELSEEAGEADFELNDDQLAVLAAMEPKLTDEFSVTLLHGVTGSGKTEIYVRAIRRVAAEGKQAILLVPEIALATQTLQRLLQRLPRVAVLHSGLTDAQRAFYYRQIREGRAAVVVGPRSAVFAPTRKLGLIVVDEEHEPSYKQDSAPRYHGRDVAVMRASLAKAPVLLGSATPSLESLHNVHLGRYELLRLPSRVRGLPMPALEIVHLRREIEPGKVELIGRTLTQRMAAALDRSEQIILLMNRRGYASFVFCPKCKWEMKCDHCERALVFHQATQLAMCHYCQSTSALPEYCPACKGKLLLFGMGIQRIENELFQKFPSARFARMDSDTMTSPKQFQKVFDEFSAGELDILLGTQMVAKGLDFPRVSLVGVISADTSLMIPDFRAAERTFQLVVQVAGRAGRAEGAGQVVVQTLHADQPAVALAADHNYDAFAEQELAERREAELPPFARMVRFIVRDKDSDRCRSSAETLTERLRAMLVPLAPTIYGPQPAGVPKIRDQFRWQVLLLTGQAGAIQQIVLPQMESLSRDIASDILADVDPITLI